ncbi:MAG: DNA polymerase III subunit gamma/tau [Verrucomicrobia bacterium]|nr:MAG: DNA polymerase III subunit gamma/tau [Verrucomicrobiota bacterium]
MSYQVIARKYRPQRFADVVGQEHVTQTLANAIKQSRIAHAYLFCGPRGTGKTTIARIFAKCLNCTGGPKVDFDDDDPRCLEIAEGRSLDVIEIDGASNRGIEEIRELRDTVKYAPATSKFKLYIIDEVHMLTKEAFNALLKTLEEPPGHVKFMFATTEPEKVLPTILSRCQRFDLRRIPAALIVRHLAQIAKQEKVKIDDTALHAIARGADGGMRDAESTLDQLISFCGEKIQESDVLSMFGLTAQGKILDLSRAILAGEVEISLRELNELAKHGKDLGRLLSDLLSHFRNLLIYQVSKGDLRLLEVSEPEAASLAAQASGVGSEALTRIMEILTDCETRLRDAASKKILIEVALLKTIEARNAASIDTVLKRLEELRRDNDAREIVSIPMPAQTPAPPPNAPPPLRAANRATLSPESASLESARTTASLAATNMSASSDGDLEQLWHQVADAVGRASPFTRSYLLEAHPVLFDRNLLTIGFDPEFADHLQLVDNAKNRTLIQTKLSEFGFADAQVKFVKAEARVNRLRPTESPVEPAAPSATAAAAPAAPKGAEEKAVPSQDKPKPGPVPFNQEDFKNDPLIQKALEIFKGQIVEVRA